MKVFETICLAVLICLVTASTVYASSSYFYTVFIFPTSAIISVFAEVVAISIYLKRIYQVESIVFRLSLYLLNTCTLYLLFFAVERMNSTLLLLSDMILLLVLEAFVLVSEGYFLYVALNKFLLKDRKVPFFRCLFISAAGNIISFFSGAIVLFIISSLFF
jgi:hypothetical protein